MKPAHRTVAGVPFRDYGAPRQSKRSFSRRERIRNRARWMQAEFGERRDEASRVGDADEDTIREIRIAGAAAGAGAKAPSGRFS